jgi:hypothetical protein
MDLYNGFPVSNSFFKHSEPRLVEPPDQFVGYMFKCREYFPVDTKSGSGSSISESDTGFDPELELLSHNDEYGGLEEYAGSSCGQDHLYDIFRLYSKPAFYPRLLMPNFPMMLHNMKKLRCIMQWHFRIS